jgi:CubicO group peptidase (beta-lactamase class C family)
MKKTIHPLIVLLLLSTGIQAQGRGEQIHELMTAAGIPGLSLAYVKNGKIDETYHLGVRSFDTGEPVDEATVFAAASLSKPIFAYGVMKLVEAGKLDLDRPLYRYLEYEDLKHDKRYEKITARLALSHTSGLPNWRRDPQLNFQYDPGERFRYSGEGFVFLMRVVEKITGQSLEEWMRETVFEPQGMERTSYIWKETLADNYAIPHNELGRTNGKYLPAEGNSAHSLQTTAVDYGRFVAALTKVEGLQKKTFDQIFSPQRNSALEKGKKALQWGLGFGLQSTDYGKAFWQWGDNGTFKAFLIGYPEKGEGLVYFTNSSMGLNVAPELLALFFPGEQPNLSWLDYGGIREPAIDLLRRVLSMSFEDAIEPYRQKGTIHQDTSLFPEEKMNQLGYQLLSLREGEAALQVFEMNMAAYPGSANVYDSYAEACLRMGRMEAAGRYYRKAYELNPENENARLIAERLFPAESPNGTQRGKTVFRLAAYGNARHVSLAGSFNDWNDLTIPMRWKNGAWEALVELAPGAYQYKFVVDGVWIPDPENPRIEAEDNFNSLLTVEK